MEYLRSPLPILDYIFGDASRERNGNYYYCKNQFSFDEKKQCNH